METTKMSFPIRFIMNLILIGGFITGLFVLVHVCVVQLDLTLGHLPEYYRQYQEEKKREAEMEKEVKPLQLSLRIKTRVTRELLKGQITLPQAAGIFRYLHELPPFDRLGFLPKVTPEKKYGGLVVRWARTEQELYPTFAPKSVVKRLEAELRDLLTGPDGWILEASPEAIPELWSQCSPHAPREASITRSVMATLYL